MGWVLIGAVITGLVVHVLLSFVGSLAVALFLYYATRPANRWLYEPTAGRGISAALTLLLIGLPILAILA
jgi:predicted PurR-regulated permease PerM